MRLLRLAEITLDESDVTAIRQTRPPRDFHQPYLQNGAQLFLADQLVALEADFRDLKDRHVYLMQEYRERQKSLDALATTSIRTRKKSSMLLDKMRKTQSKIRANYEQIGELNCSFVVCLNLAYSPRRNGMMYSYGHAQLSSPLAPVLPQRDVKLASEEEADNAFLLLLKDARLEKALELNRQID